MKGRMFDNNAFLAASYILSCDVGLIVYVKHYYLGKMKEFKTLTHNSQIIENIIYY